MNCYAPKDMADSWRTVRKHTIQVAEDIPEEKYSFRAAPDTMSVGEILAHLAATPHLANQCHFIDATVATTMDDFGRWMGEVGQVSKALTTKAAMVAALKADGDMFAAGLESMTDAKLAERVALANGEKTRFAMLLGVKEHEMHHRAQLFLMERMLGIVPHLTRARQAARAARA